MDGASGKDLPQCCRKGCRNPADGYRGLCMPCYRVAWGLIHAGKVTWKKLERLGRAKPDARKSKTREAFLAK